VQHFAGFENPRERAAALSGKNIRNIAGLDSGMAGR
jgi:hypothetical protein